MQLKYEDVESFSKQIEFLFLRHIRLEQRKISCFLDISNKNEVMTKSLINNLSTKNDVYLPVSDFSNATMSHWLYEPGDSFIENQYGIPEPKQRNFSLEPQFFDAVIVPLLAVDFSGNRLGYGKGFYDKFLSSCKPEALKIGIHFFEPIEHVPQDANDVRLDFLITPKYCYAFKQTK